MVPEKLARFLQGDITEDEKKQIAPTDRSEYHGYPATARELEWWRTGCWRIQWPAGFVREEEPLHLQQSQNRIPPCSRHSGLPFPLWKWAILLSMPETAKYLRKAPSLQSTPWTKPKGHRGRWISWWICAKESKIKSAAYANTYLVLKNGMTHGRMRFTAGIVHFRRMDRVCCFIDGVVKWIWNWMGLRLRGCVWEWDGD